MKLDQHCDVCSSWSWCGRPCKHAPKPAVLRQAQHEAAAAVTESPVKTETVKTSAPKTAVKTAFDKKAWMKTYMRIYMRKRRAKA